MDGFFKKKRNDQLNVLGNKLELCNCQSELIRNTKITGFFRDGFCNTDDQDFGLHTVCCIMTDEFLDYSKHVGNDLSTPIMEYNFPGLKKDDHWCLCASRGNEAFLNGKAPLVKLESTNILTLSLIDIDTLKKFSLQS